MRSLKSDVLFANVAQLVEHDLAKVGVASSNLVIRSKKVALLSPFLYGRPGGGIGRHAGLKIQWLRGRAGSSPAPGTKASQTCGAFCF